MVVAELTDLSQTVDRQVTSNPAALTSTMHPEEALVGALEADLFHLREDSHLHSVAAEALLTTLREDVAVASLLEEDSRVVEDVVTPFPLLYHPKFIWDYVDCIL